MIGIARHSNIGWLITFVPSYLHLQALKPARDIFIEKGHILYIRASQSVVKNQVVFFLMSSNDIFIKHSKNNYQKDKLKHKGMPKTSPLPVLHLLLKAILKFLLL